MTYRTEHRWQDWARIIQSIGQTGLHFCTNEFDRQRYQQLLDLAAEIVGEYASIPVDDLRINFNSQIGYATPKVDVRGAIFRGESVLLVKDYREGTWSLPGGWADINEPPSIMVRREVLEETGLSVKPLRLVGVYESNHDRPPLEVYHAYKLVFLCEEMGGQLQSSFETPEVAFFSIDQLPEFSSSRTKLRHVMDSYQVYCNNHLPAFFD